MSTYYGLLLPIPYTGGTYLRSIKQTQTSHDSGGINTVTFTLSNNKTETIQIRNGEAGADAGFGEITADAHTLAPSQQATADVDESGNNTAKSLAFTFGIPQGEKGETGNAAGFGEITAQATPLAPEAEPAAHVEASGPNTAKALSFTFGIPKGTRGEKGETGDAAGFGEITASVTALEPNKEPTASVTATGENTKKALAFTFGIPKGIVAALDGLFAVTIENDGDIFVYADDINETPLEYDEATGDLYYTIDK